jgi:hypothetical protein
VFDITRSGVTKYGDRSSWIIDDRFVAPYYITIYTTRKEQGLGYSARGVDIRKAWKLPNKPRKISRRINFGIINHQMDFSRNDERWVGLEEAEKMIEQGKLKVGYTFTDNSPAAA